MEDFNKEPTRIYIYIKNQMDIQKVENSISKNKSSIGLIAEDSNHELAYKKTKLCKQN
jgi:hypothetical protein